MLMESIIDAVLPSMPCWPMEWCMIRWPGCGRRQKELVFTAGRDDQIGPAIKGLRRFLATPAAGLWLLDESDAFVVEPARATSLYHLIGAVARHWARQYFPE
jgi:hypothetical protein